MPLSTLVNVVYFVITLFMDVITAPRIFLFQSWAQYYLRLGLYRYRSEYNTRPHSITVRETNVSWLMQPPVTYGANSFVHVTFFHQIQDLCFKETSPPAVRQIHHLWFYFYPLSHLKCNEPATARCKNKYCTSDRSVASNHSRFRIMCCWMGKPSKSCTLPSNQPFKTHTFHHNDCSLT